MKKEKAISLICAAALSLMVFSGCGNSDGSSSGKSENSSNTSSQADSKPKVEYEAKYQLCNPNADANAKKVYDYICENFGKNILTSQQESTWLTSPDYEMNYIEAMTDKLPAIRGLDFMNNDFDGVVERAKEWYDKGGIVTICWHTGVNGSGYNESKDDNPDFDKLLDESTEENKNMLKSWEQAANALKQLEDAGVPVLWRPFHEFDGQWFWWGKSGAEDFKKLWQYMYDKFTNEYKLNNLIWVLGYSGEVKDGWYPGDEYCDVIGSDTYDNSTNKRAWDKLEAMGTGKPMAFHECGNVPSVSQFEQDGDLWAWFMIWHTEHIEGNDPDNLRAVYNDEKVITLDELPTDLYFK